MTDNLQTQSIQDLAIDYFNQGYTPIPIFPNDKKPIGKAWQKTTYEDEAQVEAAFRDHQGNIGLLMQPDQVCIDIDALNVANDRGLELLEAFGIPTDKNVIGRKTKICGGLFLKSNFPKKEDGHVKDRIDYTFKDPQFLSANNDKEGIVETLHIGAQKLAEPSKFNGEQFTWTRPQGELAFVDHKVIKAACDWIYVLSLLSFGYPKSFSRDRGMLKLAHVLSKTNVESSFASAFMNILAENNKDYERSDKDWSDQIEQAKEEKFNLAKKFDEYWNLPEAAVKAILKKLPISKEEEDEEEDYSIQTDWEVCSVADITEANAVARNWAIQNLAQKGTYTQIHGTGGAAKTQIILTIALLSTGQGAYFCELFKLKKPIKTLYISNEDSKDELDRRILTILKGLKQYDTNNRDVPLDRSKVDYKSFVNKPLRLVSKTPQGNLKVITENVEHLKSIIRKGGYDHVILDPIITFHEVEENSNPEMDFFIRNGVIAVAVDCHVAITGIHHEGKAGSNNSLDIEANTNAARGASAITNAARSVIRISNMGYKVAKEIWQDYKTNPKVLEQRYNYTQIAWGKTNNAKATEGNWINKHVVEFKNAKGEKIEGIVPIRDASIENLAKDAEKRRREEAEKRQSDVMITLDKLGFIDQYREEKEHYFSLMDVARWLKEHNDEYVADISKDNKKNDPAFRKDPEAIASHLKGIFQSKGNYKEKDFQFVSKKIGSGNNTRWIRMSDEVIEASDKDIEEAGEKVKEKLNLMMEEDKI